MSLPTFSSYGKYSNSNYGAHCLQFTDSAGHTYWFSYKTMVAFQTRQMAHPVVLKNYWGRTTGKHLNAIDNGNKKTRVDSDTFARLYEKNLKLGRL